MFDGLNVRMIFKQGDKEEGVAIHISEELLHDNLFGTESMNFEPIMRRIGQGVLSLSRKKARKEELLNNGERRYKHKN